MSKTGVALTSEHLQDMCNLIRQARKVIEDGVPTKGALCLVEPNKNLGRGMTPIECLDFVASCLEEDSESVGGTN